MRLGLGLSMVLAGLPWSSLARATGAAPAELTVFAAASLRETFQRLAEDFEKRHAGVKVRLSFAGSQELCVQIEQGARADVLASADSKHMQALQMQSLATAAHVFARNEPVVIVPIENPAKLARFADLAGARRIVVGAPEVPIGAYTEAIFSNAERKLGAAFGRAVAAHIRSRELNVRQVLAKVALAEADAGIVYRTDALAARDKVVALAIPNDMNTLADYSIAVLSGAPEPALAKAWVAFVLGDEGQERLRAAGFRPAPSASPGVDPR